MLAIELDSETEARLDRLAESTGQSKAFFAQRAILEYLEDLEDTSLAEQRLNSPGKTLSAAEVKRELDLPV